MGDWETSEAEGINKMTGIPDPTKIPNVFDDTFRERELAAQKDTGLHELQHREYDTSVYFKPLEKDFD